MLQDSLGFSLSAESVTRVEGVVGRYPDKQAALLPVLWIVQEEKGWISPAAMAWVADRLECSAATVQSVVTFYSMFDDRPVGTYKLQVCRTLSCELMGARAVIDRIRERLGIAGGETTADGRFTLQEVECLGACGTGPMLQCNLKFYENLTLERVDALLDELARGGPAWTDAEPVIYPRPDDAAYAAMRPQLSRAEA